MRDRRVDPPIPLDVHHAALTKKEGHRQVPLLFQCCESVRVTVPVARVVVGLGRLVHDGGLGGQDHPGH